MLHDGKFERLKASHPTRSRVSSKKDGHTSSLFAHRNTGQGRGPPILKVKNPRVAAKVAAKVYIPSTVSICTLAQLLGIRLEVLRRRMIRLGMAEHSNYDYVMTSDYAALLVEEFGRKPIVNDEAAFDIYPPPPAPLQPSSLNPRSPVVTIMGHVDHGKTTLLDKLRSTSVAKGEAGGITQHIGAFSVDVPSSSGPSSARSITFLDTPGHAAFSAMRARGARVTDIIVLVIAADDGVMPQTKEVIRLIKKEQENVGVIVAISKVDKPGADVDAVKRGLFAEDIHVETLGGEIPSVEVSGVTGEGLQTLLETISVMAEMQDLRADNIGPLQGYVLESKLHKGLGPVATVLVLRGSLKPGSHVIGGLSSAKVKTMRDSTGSTVKAAYPGTAVMVSGWKTLPNAGDEVLQGTEAEVKKALANRVRRAEDQNTLAQVDLLNSQRRQDREKQESNLPEADEPEQEDQKKELRLVIKADVSGSLEAVQGALQHLGNQEATTRIIFASVGDVTESDVMLAKTTGGTIVAFSVSVPKSIEVLAAQHRVPISSSNIIYTLTDDITRRVIELLPTISETKVTGEATVLRLFNIQLKAKQYKKVAGCRVTNGLVEKNKFARLVRDGLTLHDGTFLKLSTPSYFVDQCIGLLDTLRILKKDVMQVRKGTECGLCFGASFDDIQEGDIIQIYEKVEKPGIL